MKYCVPTVTERFPIPRIERQKMGFDPKEEPCGGCGRELDECLCGLAPDLEPVTNVGDSDSDFCSEHWIEEE